MATAAFKPITQAGASVSKNVQAVVKSGPSAGGSLSSTASKAVSMSKSIASVSQPVTQVIQSVPVLSSVAKMGANAVPQKISVPTHVSPATVKPAPVKYGINLSPTMDRISKSVESVVKAPITSPVFAPVRQAGGATMQAFTQQVQPRSPTVSPVSRVLNPIASIKQDSVIASMSIHNDDSMASQMLRRQNQQAKRQW